ncbi:glutamine-hydrolyzing GMP synthase [Candidatus Peregrinibacteria bacterium]|nr:glutamine-hydrolyzing GMP synthase [Candidatus Peregrinibacteria bacterium]
MDKVAVIDFGSQYAHLIANRLRRRGVYSEVVLPDTPSEKLAKYKGLILSGGPNSVYEHGAPTISPRIFLLGIPILGICYGHHLIAHLLGGKVETGKTKEYGIAKLSVLKKIGIFDGIRDHTQVWMSHGDTVLKLPSGFVALAKTPDCPIAAAADPAKRIFSIQFHAEVAHTAEGMKMLDNFLNICRVKREWSIEKFLEQKIQQIRYFAGDKKIFMLVSGGVDSTVAYVFLAKVLGQDRIYGLFIDTGFLRKDEAKKIVSVFKKARIKNFHALNAKRRFVSALAGVINPEEKRKIIGDMFLTMQAEAARKLKLNPDQWILGQGTIYPDTIESAGTKHADKIKTHHNRVPEILELIRKGRIIEPLADLYKDEVRALGSRLGLPDKIVWKHPFPGPGLAVRILCAAEAYLPKNVSAEEDAITQYLVQHGLKGKILPIQSVGVQGDNRTYFNPLVVWGDKADFSDLENISTALTNRFFMINRVCFLLSPSKIENAKIIPSTLTEKRIKLAQELDDIVMKFIEKNRIEREIWQFPTILVPLSINGVKSEAVVLRPVCSEEAMTANFYKMNIGLLKKLTKKLTPKVSAVLFDITNKPPGTIEWE